MRKLRVRRIADYPPREVNTASLAAYTEPNKKETPDYMRELRRMEDKLEELYRQMDARIKGQMNQNFDIRSLASLKQLNTNSDHYKAYSPKNFAS